MISWFFPHSDSDFCRFPPGGEGGEGGTGGTPRHGEGLAARVAGGRAPTPRCTGHAGHAGHGVAETEETEETFNRNEDSLIDMYQLM